MKNKKGFTLIELLAVIVILAVIALIATPLIMNVINDAKRSSVRDSAYGFLKAAETYFAQEQIKDPTYKGETFDIMTDKKLALKGTRYPGKVMVNANGDSAIAINEDGYCYYKGVHESEVHMAQGLLKCDLDMANNMVKNGYGEYGDNTNFKEFTYQDGVFKRTSSSSRTMVSDEFIPIDPNKKYEIKITIKSNNPNATYLSGISEYDVDKKSIQPSYVMYIGRTLTTLKKDLNNGDTVVYLDDISNWMQQPIDNVYTDINKGIIFWNYKDSTGHLYEPEFYSRNVWYPLYEFSNVDKVNHTITLNEPWEKGTIKAGTKLSQSMSGNMYNYGLLANQKISSTFQVYQNIMQGFQESKTESKKFRPGTKYIKFLLGDNYNNQPNTTTEIKDIVIREVAD